MSTGVRRLTWLAIFVALAVALAVGAAGSGGEPTAAERTARIARTVRCPTCQGLSAAESDAKAAVAVRDEIRRRVERGEPDATIKAFLVSRYGREILLTPEAAGPGLLVWVLPVAFLAAGGVGLSIAFARWRVQERAVRVSAEDAAVVAAALSEAGPAGGQEAR